MDRQDKLNLRNLLWQGAVPGAGLPVPAVPEPADEDALWARAMISELSADPAIWSNPSGPDPDWALADLQDDAGFLDELISGGTFLGGDDAEDSADQPALGPDPALDDLFADLAVTPPKPKRRSRPALFPADPALVDIFGQLVAESDPVPPLGQGLNALLGTTVDATTPPAATPPAAESVSEVQSEKPQGFRALRRAIMNLGHRRRVDG